MASKGSRSFENEEYVFVDSLELTLGKDNTHEDGTFTLCFWIYLLKNSKPGCIVRQAIRSLAPLPFLTIDEEQRLTLHPLSLQESPVVSGEICPFEKWVHLGCEVGHSTARLHMDGVITGETPLKFPPRKEDALPLTICGADKNVQAYVHHVCALPQPSVTNHYVKNPPLELSLDGWTGGTADDEVVEEGGEGGDAIWSVVGGKASCRRNFALDVVLLDALGRSVHKDLELVASLVYADTGLLVEKPKDDAEAPLLTTFDGVEFPSTDRPIRLVHGRASFKLKISQLSSKCDNRLFRVCFESPSTPKLPFLRALSRSIRCVSRNRNSNRPPSAPFKRSIGTVFPDLTDPPSGEDKTDPPKLIDPSTNGPPPHRIAPPAKIQRLSEEKTAIRMHAAERAVDFHGLSKHDTTAVPAAPVSGPKPSAWPSLRSHNPQQQQTQEDQPEDADTSKKPVPEKGPQQVFPDYLIFKYCLETIHSRAAFLRGIISSRSDEELNELAVRISQCTGCHHNGYQVLIAKSLLQDGEEFWRQLVKGSSSVSWILLLSKLDETFRQISGRTKRRFTEKDGEFLRGICGAGESVTLEQFEKLWHWLYPVAMTVSSPQVRETWENVQEPKWIEGMITRKDAEDQLLKAPGGVPSAGSFVLRFATRFWPHPDAGALVVSYVGADFRINHRLLNIDNRACTDENAKPLCELLLAQPELTRSHR